MASSDDEEETAPTYVDNYYFEDADETSVSFAVLPVLLEGSNGPHGVEKELSLRGTSDKGLQKVYEQVIAWKLGFEANEPQIFVLTKERKWIRLEKPRKSYLEETLRTTMITIHMLHFLRRNPEATDRSAWDHIHKIFSIFDVRPSDSDLRDHVSLIKHFREKDTTLGKSEVLLGFLNGKCGDWSPEEIPDIKQNFIVEDDEVDGVDEAGDSDDEDLFRADSVCAFCDNGGELLCCEGKCLRSFHATEDDGEDSDCISLGFTRAAVQEIKNFFCKNCKYHQHQCFACGKLGSSDKLKGAEVFRCVNATCGHFYHPKCVAELLFPEDTAKASMQKKKIAEGESFLCPAHECAVCKKGEDKNVRDLQFALCRRCPRSYHRKCLPREISFEDSEDEDILPRAWEGLLPNQILIYCLEHEIDEDLRTPIRNHIKFPDGPEKEKAGEVCKNKIKIHTKKKMHPSNELSQGGSVLKADKILKKNATFEERKFRGETSGSLAQKALGSLKKTKLFKDGSCSEFNKDASHVSGHKSVPVKTKKSEEPVNPPSVKQIPGIVKTSFPPIDSKTEERVKTLIEKNEVSLTVDDIIKKSMIPSTHAYGARHVDRNISSGKVEASIEAVQTALRKLEAGCTVAEAKAVCDPNIVRQLFKWNNKLKVYLSPFLHGMRYTSFGRHFTKLDKLKEIVDTLQWYVQDGDTIVDFCCGANDFSQLMKEKLDLAGKKCSFKNYDLIRPKNDFNFEKSDWLKVKPQELPSGSKLIMGLNPPFGVKGALANKFIDKALAFKPKLVILIVPKETERLDEKDPPYDLIWEDGKSLSGKSFYLPGSIDVNDKQMDQWNVSPPLLYLWSRQDWTSKHKDIAVRHGHTSTPLKEIKELPQEASLAERSLEFHPKGHAKLELESSDRHVECTESNLEVNKVPGIRNASKKRNFQNMDDNKRGSETCMEVAKSTEDFRRKKFRGHKGRPHKNEQPIDKTEAELSDMSISPEHTDSRNKSMGFPTESRETSADRVHKRRDSYQNSVPGQKRRESSLDAVDKRRGSDNVPRVGNSRPRQFDSIDTPITSIRSKPIEDAPEWMIPDDDAYPRSVAQSQPMYGMNRSSAIPYDGSNEVSRGYPSSSATEGTIGQGSHLWQGIEFDKRDFGARNLGEPLTHYWRDDNSMMPYGSTGRYGRYSDTEMQRQPQGFYGMQDNWEQRNTFSQRGTDTMYGGQSGFTPMSLGRPAPDSGTSIMQRYVPNLAETNYVRPGYHAGNNTGNVHSTRDILPDPRGFASGPSMYPYSGSTPGWLDD